MGGRQIRPARVYQTVTQELRNRAPGSSSNPPPWYGVMTSVPPAETLVRTVAPRHGRPSKAKKPRNIFRPQQIVYLEDELRQIFFKDHPWELARPRIILELDGKDNELCDWSKGLRQTGIPLTGESVVQRQMWLMENEGMPETKAYDITRHEFYRHRQAEEIEKRIALEEARHVGAYFGKTRIDVGHILENREFENWKIWAGKETEKQEARRNSEIESFGTEDEEEADADTGADAADEAAATTDGAAATPQII